MRSSSTGIGAGMGVQRHQGDRNGVLGGLIGEHSWDISCLLALWETFYLPGEGGKGKGDVEGIFLI